MKPVVAIDGPAGSGKGTLARMIASHFGFMYLDTGVLYRAIAFLDISVSELEYLTITSLLNEISKLTNEQLRSDENSVKSSNIAKIPKVREQMTRLQRDYITMYKDKGVVLDGRDIGTVVVPDAVCKLFITADLKERAMRRYTDLKDKESISFEEVLHNMELRDNQDKSRKHSPLTCDETYVIVNTTQQSVEESFETCKEEIIRAFRSSGILGF